MASKHNRSITKTGRVILTSNPQRGALSFPAQPERKATPISMKKATERAGGIALPKVRGASVPTSKGSIVARRIKKGAITYKYALV